MQITPAALAQIIEQASSLPERLTNTYIPRDSENATFEAAISVWESIIGSPDRLKRRLAFQDLELDHIKTKLGRVARAETAPVPPWAETLSRSVAAAQKSHSCFDPQHPQPFEVLLSGFLTVAEERLSTQPGYRLLSETAQKQSYRGLLALLSENAAPSFFKEFSTFRGPRQSGFAQLFQFSQGDHPTVIYQEFIEQCLNGGLADLFLKYSALARLLATQTDLWCEAMRDLLQRLEADWHALEQTFGQTLHQVADLRLGLSDLHRGGRTTVGLTFDPGWRLVYKPKALGMETAFNAILAWLNQQGITYPFSQLRILARPDYGWVEFVAHDECQTSAALEAYYHRAGGLACLVYALNGTDFHAENVIATATQPVLIDLEMLLVAQLRQPAGDTLHALDRLFAQSVLTTGLISSWSDLPDGQRVDISGLGGSKTHATRYKIPTWFNTNTDDMHRRMGEYDASYQLNTAMLNGQPALPIEYMPQIEAGFREVYQLLLTCREAFIREPLALLANQEARFIVRATQAYVSLRRHLAQPEFMESGLRRSLQIEGLARGLIADDVIHPLLPVFPFEASAIQVGDVPIFTYQPEANALILAPGQTVPDIFEATGLQAAIDRLNGLSDTDLEFQIRLIQGALRARFPKPTVAADMRYTRESIVPLSTDQFIEEAARIGDRILKKGIVSSSGMNWLQMEYFPHLAQYQFQPMSYGLYDGISGVALFFAALDRLKGGYREAIEQILRPIRMMLNDPVASADYTRYFGIGGLVGVDSIAYVLCTVADLLNLPEYREDARQVSQLITPKLIQADTRLDFVGGAAGTILNLIKLHRATHDPTFLDRAVLCGQHLLAHRVTALGGYRVWRTLDAELTGFAHGAAGIGYALLCLYGTCGEEVFREAACEAFAYERSLFSDEAKNWPDLRPGRGTTPAYRSMWCHGGPGIGLSRLNALQWLDDPLLHSEIETALDISLHDDLLQGVDHLCCGSFGRIDIFLEVSQRLNRPNLYLEATRQATWILDRAAQQGHFIFANAGEDNFGLFQGMSGIGYGLLRIAHPDLVPSVLSLQ
jgi:type 2 lantibiotic biosynthesis protein LanM